MQLKISVGQLVLSNYSLPKETLQILGKFAREVLMKVGLFVPCYIDQFYPKVAFSTLRLLEHYGVEVDYPSSQTCCGQPFLNSGFAKETLSFARKFSAVFQEYEAIVCPSGSCTSLVKHHYKECFLGEKPQAVGFESAGEVFARVYELCEFLYDILGVRGRDIPFPYRVGLHQSCHGLRELELGCSSERVGSKPNKVRALLASLPGIELVQLDRADECCGFGGSFAVDEESMSVLMGNDRIADHIRAGAQVITGVDMSCLMHLDGLLRRQALPIRVFHVAEILAGDALL